MRLFGIPCGASPIRPEGCAPTGLKYRSSAIFHVGSAFATSRRISSAKSFVRPYGFVASKGASSANGGSEALP